MAAEKDAQISRTPLLERSKSEINQEVELTNVPTSNSLPTVVCLPSRPSAKDLKSFERETPENTRISLHQAARDGKLELVKWRLQRYGKNCSIINKADVDGNTVLHYAVRYNYLKIVKLLLEYGADIEVQGEANATPLHYAARFRPVAKGPLFSIPRESSRMLSGPSPSGSPCSSPKSSKKLSLQPSKPENVEGDKGTEPGEKTSEENRDKKEVAKEGKKNDSPYVGLNKMTRDRLSALQGKKKETLGGRILKELQLGDRLRGVSASNSLSSIQANTVQLTADLSIIQYLLSCGADINARDAYGSTPLHYAVAKGNPVAVKELLDDLEINVEAKDKTKMTPLHCAASQGCYAVANCLIDAGADLRCLDEEQMTPLHFACMEGNLAVAQLLLDTADFIGGWNLVSKMVTDQDREEQTALHLAVEGGHMDLAKLCLQQGSNVNETKTNLSTPLHLAATGGDLEIVKLLIDHDADIEAKNILQETPLHRAAMFNRVEIVHFLITKGAYMECRDKDKDTPLLIAAGKNHIDTFKFLMEHGADISAKDINDGTSLFRAASEGCIEIIKFLLKTAHSKALIEECNKYENTALHIAAQKGYVKIVQLLLDAGSTVDSKNDEAMTPLHLATKNGKLRTVCALLNRDPSIINDEDEASNTPLHLAALYGHDQLVKQLLVRGAAIDARNTKLWTPLDCAAARGWVETATLLLDENAPVDPTDKAKTTPLHLACKEGHLEMVKLLLSQKANITLKDSAGRNCLDLAIENNHRYVAMAIIDHDDWKLVMRNRIKEGNVVTSPMRKLIKKLPDVAEYVFKRCVEFNRCRPDSPDYAITLNYEFLDDVNVDWTGLSDRMEEQEQESHTVVFKIKSALPEKASKQNEIKSNHPLMLMVARERVKLLSHPLVTYLLRYKWRSFGRYVYYSKLILYLTFLCFLTGYAMVTTKNLPLTKCVNKTFCVCQMNFGQPMTGSEILWRTIGKPVIILTTVLNLFIEFVQFCYVWRFYFRWHRLVEVPAYVFSLLYVVDEIQSDGKSISINSGSRCYYWHNSLGATAVYLAWTGLLLFMRKFPKLGIYVVMFTEILRTFAQFFIVLGLFIIAFGLGFHVLIYDQIPFSTPGRSMLKTTMGMLGEYEYDTVYNEFEVPPITWALYVLFLIINCTILMNLLVGLAVDDIKGVQEKAGLKRLAMQVDLVLDVEKALPAVLRKKFITSQEVIHPNKTRYWTIWSFWEQTIPPARAFKEAMNLEKTPLEKIQRQQEGLKEELQHVKQKLKAVVQHTAHVELMMKAMMKHQGLAVDQEQEEGDDD